MSIKKRLLGRVDKMANIEKENSKSLSKEEINTLIIYFQSHEWLRNVNSGDCKEKNRMPLPTEDIY